MEFAENRNLVVHGKMWNKSKFNVLRYTLKLQKKNEIDSKLLHPDSQQSKNLFTVGHLRRNRNFVMNWDASKSSQMKLKNKRKSKMRIKNFDALRMHAGDWRTSARAKLYKSSKIQQN